MQLREPPVVRVSGQRQRSSGHHQADQLHGGDRGPERVADGMRGSRAPCQNAADGVARTPPQVLRDAAGEPAKKSPCSFSSSARPGRNQKWRKLQRPAEMIARPGATLSATQRGQACRCAAKSSESALPRTNTRSHSVGGFGAGLRRREEPNGNVGRALANVQHGAMTIRRGAPENDAPSLASPLPANFRIERSPSGRVPLIVEPGRLFGQHQRAEYAGARSQARGHYVPVHALGDLARFNVPVQQPQQLLADERE